MLSISLVLNTASQLSGIGKIHWVEKPELWSQSEAKNTAGTLLPSTCQHGDAMEDGTQHPGPLL